MLETVFQKSQLSYSVLLAIFVGLVGVGVAASLSGMFSSRKLDVQGKHCYVTGGSSGLGRAVAIELVKRGAHVTIVARGQKRLEEVEAELRALAQPHQKIHRVVADLTLAEDSRLALIEATSCHHGKVPDEVYLCAGASYPTMFIDAEPELLSKGMDMTYWVQAWTAHAATKMMVRRKIKGRIVFVASFLGYTSFAGYSPYSPGKYAIRGLADTLRSELLQHSISVHLYMPAGIDSPGYVEEQKTKPRITRKIEQGDVVLLPESVAASLFHGLERQRYQITNVLITDLVRVKSCGAVPGNGWVYDSVLGLIAHIGLPIWRMITDSQVRKDAPAVHKELQERGFYRPEAEADT